MPTRKSPNGDARNQPSLTLSEFINENHKLITVLGVFMALALYTRGLGKELLPQLLSLLFLGEAAIIAVELGAKLPSTVGQFPLLLFEILLYPAVFLLVSLWFAQYLAMEIVTWFLPISSAVLGTFVLALKLYRAAKLAARFEEPGPES